MADVFISYAREDKDFVIRVHEELKKINREDWIDWKDIPPTAEWMNEIQSAIEAANFFVFVISPESVSSEVCSKEIAHAVKHNKRLIPILHHEVDDQTVPEILRKLNWIFFRETDDFEASFKTLIDAINTDLDWVRIHTRLLVRAREWDSKGRDKSLLSRGSDLRDFEEWLAHSGDKEPKPITIQTQYIIEGRKNETARKNRLLFGITFALVVVIIFAFVTFFLYRVSEKRRMVALSRQLSSEALDNIESQRDLALLLSLQARLFSDTVEARSSLFAALTNNQTGPVRNVPIHKGAHKIAFSPDSKRIALVNSEGSVEVRFLSNFYPQVQAFEGAESVSTSIAWSPDGNVVALGGSDGSITLWDISTQQKLHHFHEGHGDKILSMVFSQSSKKLISVNSKGEIIEWNLGDLGMNTRSQIPFSTNIRYASFDAGGKFLALGVEESVIRLWDMANDQPFGQPLQFSGELVSSIALRPGGHLLASTDGNTIALWNLDNHKQIGVSIRDSKQQIQSITFSPDGSILAWADGRSVSFWDIIRRLSIGRPFRAHETETLRVAFDSNGHFLVSASRDGSIRLWDTVSLHLVKEIRRGDEAAKFHTQLFPNTALVGLTFDEKGTKLATWNRDGAVSLWDVSSGKLLEPILPGKNETFIRFAISSTGDTVALASKTGTIEIWNFLNGKWVAKSPIRYKPCKSLALSSDAEILASASFGEIAFWDAATGSKIEVHLEGLPTNVLSITFWPDKNMFLTLHEQGNTIKVWDLGRGEIHTDIKTGYEDQSAQFYGIDMVFRPDGEMLAIIGEEIVLLDVPSWRQIGTVRCNRDRVSSATFSSDSKFLASACPDGTIIIWDLEDELEGPASWQTYGCLFVNRNLTCEEWQQYLADEPYMATCHDLVASEDCK